MSSDTAATRKQLKIKTGVVKRFVAPTTSLQQHPLHTRSRLDTRKNCRSTARRSWSTKRSSNHLRLTKESRGMSRMRYESVCFVLVDNTSAAPPPFPPLLNLFFFFFFFLFFFFFHSPGESSAREREHGSRHYDATRESCWGTRGSAGNVPFYASHSLLCDLSLIGISDVGRLVKT